jgi:predicted transcriptional regulator of viral defense system
MKNPNEVLSLIFKENHGYLSSRELNKKSSLYVALRLLVEQGIVEKIKPGLYRLSAFIQRDELTEVAKIYPQGIFCMFSAWHYYELIGQIPPVNHIAFPNKAKVKLLDYPPVKVYYWSAHLLGLQQIQSDGFTIFSLEKSVCDAVKFRNKIGKDTMAEILRNYLKRKDKDLNLLFHVARQMRMKSLLRDYLNLIHA